MASNKVYWDALNRLVNNNPINVPKGTRINNDTVALEAGRKRGAIKKSRSTQSKLVAAIAAAASDENTTFRKLENRNVKLKENVEDFKRSKQDDLNRQLMLLNEIYKLRKQLNELECSRPDCPLLLK